MAAFQGSSGLTEVCKRNSNLELSEESLHVTSLKKRSHTVFALHLLRVTELEALKLLLPGRMRKFY